jgi:hypothetical protein
MTMRLPRGSMIGPGRVAGHVAGLHVAVEELELAAGAALARQEVIGVGDEAADAGAVVGSAAGGSCPRGRRTSASRRGCTVLPETAPMEVQRRARSERGGEVGQHGRASPSAPTPSSRRSARCSGCAARARPRCALLPACPRRRGRRGSHGETAAPRSTVRAARRRVPAGEVDPVSHRRAA